MANLGDVWFQDIGCGAVCDAINGVTPGWRGAEINHCGLVVEHGGALKIAEAISPRVRLTPIEEFLARARDRHGRPRIIVASLRPEYAALAAEASGVAKSFLNRPYDARYLPNRAELYCSELIVVSFKQANRGVDVFPEKPMTFKDPATGRIHDFWIAYYAQFGSEVPEGEIGSNPGELSLSEKLHGHTQLGDLRGLPL